MLWKFDHRYKFVRTVDCWISFFFVRSSEVWRFGPRSTLLIILYQVIRLCFGCRLDFPTRFYSHLANELTDFWSPSRLAPSRLWDYNQAGEARPKNPPPPTAEVIALRAPSDDPAEGAAGGTFYATNSSSGSWLVFTRESMGKKSTMRQRFQLMFFAY